MLVTEIVSIDKRRSKVFLDEGFAFVLYKGELRKFQIEQNQELKEDDYLVIIREILPKRARERALYYLRAQDRTEAEVRRKLTEGGYPASICNEVLSFLKEYHYIDDSAYALRYIENYKEQKSQKKLYYDLLKKGIMKDLIDSILEEQPCEEEQQIVRWLEKKRIDPANMDKKECQKAMQALARRGFSWDRIRGVFHL